MALPMPSWLRSSRPAAASASGVPATAATMYWRVQMNAVGPQLAHRRPHAGCRIGGDACAIGFQNVIGYGLQGLHELSGPLVHLVQVVVGAVFVGRPAETLRELRHDAVREGVRHGEDLGEDVVERCHVCVPVLLETGHRLSLGEREM